MTSRTSACPANLLATLLRVRSDTAHFPEVTGGLEAASCGDGVGVHAGRKGDLQPVYDRSFRADRRWWLPHFDHMSARDLASAEDLGKAVIEVRWVDVELQDRHV